MSMYQYQELMTLVAVGLNNGNQQQTPCATVTHDTDMGQ